MFIKNSQQNIIIDFPKHVKKIGMKLSGGLDSSLMLYMVCKYIQDENIDATIIPITIEKHKVKFHFKFSELVINYCKEKFPNVVFGKHQKENQYSNSGHNSTQHIYVKKLIKEKIIDCHFFGGTANPPESVVFKNPEGLILDPPPDRIFTGELIAQTLEINNYFYYRPFINIDKKGIYELYKKFDLMDSLFLLTRSCENESIKKTNNYTTHCKNDCWDCFERKWGFEKINNKYDIEITSNEI